MINSRKIGAQEKLGILQRLPFSCRGPSRLVLVPLSSAQRFPWAVFCIGALLFGAAFVLSAAFFAFSLCSFSTASFAAARSSVFWAFFCLMSSSNMPTIAFWTFVDFFVRFFPASSAFPFLFFRRQFCVHVNFTALMR